MMGDYGVAHGYDRDLRALRTLDLTSPASARIERATSCSTSIPCFTASIWLRSAPASSCSRTTRSPAVFKQLAIAGPRAALRRVTYRCYSLLHRIARPGADVVLPARRRPSRPGLLRSEWNRSRTMVGRTS